jgi:predicted metallopeptidase
MAQKFTLLNLIKRASQKKPVTRRKRKASSEKIDWQKAPDLDKRVYELIRGCDLDYVNKFRVFCYRSTKSKTRAYARIWGLNKLWQRTLEVEPAYILEVISEKFDRLSPRERDLILVHELMHIPKNFSGALLPHRGGRMYEHRVHEVYARYQETRNKRK